MNSSGSGPTDNVDERHHERTNGTHIPTANSNHYDIE
jgi:hypothetical protein